jgi:hypothetical protein
MEASPISVSVVLDVSLTMPLMDLHTTAVRSVNRLVDALDRSESHVFAGCVAFATGARVFSRDELSDLDWDFEYRTAITAGIELATELLDKYPKRRLVLITSLTFKLPLYPEPHGYPDAPEEQLASWAERALRWNDDRDAEELDRVRDALAAAVLRDAVVDLIACDHDRDVPATRRLERLGELVTASGGVVGELTRSDDSAFASLHAAMGLPPAATRTSRS